MEGGADILASQPGVRDHLSHAHTTQGRERHYRWNLERWTYKSQGVPTRRATSSTLEQPYTIQLSLRLRSLLLAELRVLVAGCWLRLQRDSFGAAQGLSADLD